MWLKINNPTRALKDNSDDCLSWTLTKSWLAMTSSFFSRYLIKSKTDQNAVTFSFHMRVWLRMVMFILYTSLHYPTFYSTLKCPIIPTTNLRSQSGISPTSPTILHPLLRHFIVWQLALEMLQHHLCFGLVWCLAIEDLSLLAIFHLLYIASCYYGFRKHTKSVGQGLKQEIEPRVNIWWILSIK